MPKLEKYTASDKYANELEKYTKLSIDFGVVLNGELGGFPWKYLTEAKAWALTDEPKDQFYKEFWSDDLGYWAFRSKIIEMLGDEYNGYPIVMDFEDNYLLIQLD